MFKRAWSSLVNNRLLLGICFILYVTLLGPFLISSKSTELVVLGIVLLGLLVWWLVSFLKGVFK